VRGGGRLAQLAASAALVVDIGLAHAFNRRCRLN